jgi:peptidyl-prolyl cis-trans isomerase C
MRKGYSSWLAVVVVSTLGLPGLTQEKVPTAPQSAQAPAAPQVRPAAPPPQLPPPPANAVAVTVNGQAIPEVTVYRALKRVPPDKQVQARTEIIKFLIDNTLIDQYLIQQKVPVDPKLVEVKWNQVKEEVQKQNTTLEKMMQELLLTEAELRAQITGQLRWEKFLTDQATDKALKDLFDANRKLFDGTMVRARHILLSPPSSDPRAQADAKARLLAIKQDVEKQAAEGLAKLPPQTDNLGREAARTKLIDEAFAAYASKESACPSNAQGGSLGWFPYASMVEPFAKAAFALKPYQMSDVVTTQFGHHLILVTDRKEGTEPKFDDVKEDVKEVFCDQLRERLCNQLRAKAQIQVAAPAAKP